MHFKRIRELREDKDLTQNYMASLLNINQRTYSRYETGEREIPLSSLIQIANFHKVSIDYLLELTDQKKPYPPSNHHNKYDTMSRL